MIPSEWLNTITTGDARELAKRIPDESIDLIFTDPPYLRAYLPLYAWLAQESARILKPSGFLLTYVGGFWKDEVMRMMREHLEFFWDYQMYSQSDSTVIWPRRTIARVKSLLAYRRKGTVAMPRTNVLGLWVGGGIEKQYHIWQQDESTARYYIDCFSQARDFILDPFTGSGTTEAMCRVLGRNYIGFEIEPHTAEQARARIRNTQMPLFVTQPEQTELMLNLETA